LQRAWVQNQGLPADSLRARTRLLARTRSCYGNRRLDRAGYTYWYEAAAHAKLQQFPEAFDAFSDFFDRFHPVPDSLPAPIQESLEDQISEMYWTRGFLHYLLGDLTSAVTDYLSAFRAIPTSNRQRRATIIMDVGVIYQRLQDFDAAEQYFQRAERIIGRADSLDADLRNLRVRALFRTADLILEREFSGHPDSTAFQRAFSLVRRGKTLLSDPDSDLYGKQLVLMTDVSATVGQIDSALVYNRRTLQWARRNGDVHTRMLALLKRGWIEQRRGDWAASVPYLRQSLSMARHRRDLNTQRRILKRIGLAHEMQAKWQESEAAYREAVAVVEAYRSSLRSTQWSLTAFSQWQDVYRGLVRVLLAQDRPREAFRVLEATRARHLTDLRIRSRVSEELPARDRVRYDSLTQAITDLRTQISSRARSNLDSLRTRETQLVAERRRLLVLTDTSRSVRIDSLQKRLAREDRSIISYFLDDPPRSQDRSARSYVFVLTADTLRTVALPDVTADSVQTLLEGVSSLFASSTTLPGINSIHFDLDDLYDIYRTVFQPVIPHVDRGARLSVLPDGPLHRLPFSMLVTRPPNQRFSYGNASYLIGRHAISMEVSARLAVGATGGRSAAAEKPVDIAALGVSEFPTARSLPASLRSTVSGVTTSSGTRSVADAALAAEETGGGSTVRLSDLPGVDREIRSLRRITASGHFNVDEEATESAFHVGKQSAKVLHLASHAFVHPTSPLYNSFLLAPGDTTSSSEDGWLFLHEIQTGASSEIPLVVLSGCSTAEGTLRSGEGMEGLQYAFRAIGAQSTLSNLWPADDEAAVELTRTFYRFLKEGHPKDVALRKAQLQYIDHHPDRASPFFWASTVLYGSPAPVPIGEPAHWMRLLFGLSVSAWLAVGVALAFSIGAAVWLRRLASA
jgi:CHAT domain-containing protein/tetratricopeptide (TPR) repeat protein